VVNGIRDLKDTSPLLSLIAYVLILALNTLSDVSGSADDGREYSSGIIFT
jgi:cell division protein ZapA (FtsZ GTPase activity inhibitor)